MKRIFLLLVFSLIITVSLTANTAINIRGGFLVPSGSKTSFMPGASYGINVDDIVELTVGMDLFYNNYTESRVASFDTTKAGNIVDIVKTGTDVKTIYVPLMTTLKISFPLEMAFTPYGGVGLGWAILWEDIFVPASDEPNQEHNAIEESDIYNGFNWILQLGARYQLSPNVHFYGESFYNFGKMKKDIKRDEYGRTWDEIDMSGLGLRIGVEMALR